MLPLEVAVDRDLARNVQNPGLQPDNGHCMVCSGTPAFRGWLSYDTFLSAGRGEPYFLLYRFITGYVSWRLQCLMKYYDTVYIENVSNAICIFKFSRILSITELSGKIYIGHCTSLLLIFRAQTFCQIGATVRRYWGEVMQSYAHFK